MRQHRVFGLLGLAIGLLLSVPVISVPALAAEPSALLTAAAGYPAEKAVNSVTTTSTAAQAQHATASASASRLCSGNACSFAKDTINVYSLTASGVGLVPGIAHPNNDGFVMRDPGDENDSDPGANGLIATGGGDDDDGERMPLAA